MDEIAARRKALFSGAAFSSLLLYNGDVANGTSANFSYFSGCSVDGSYLVLKKNKGVLFTHEMNIKAARKTSYYPVKLFGKKPAAEMRKAAGSGKVGFAASEMPAARYLALRRKTHLKLVDASGKMFEVRGRKSKSELKLLSKAAGIARGILHSLEPWKCKTEKELAAKLRVMALEEGAEISFEPIVATGANSAMPHHIATEKKLQDFVLVDFGVKYKGYCSDLTRCYFRKGAKKEKESYDKCKAVFEELLEALPSCKKGKDVAALSASLLKKYGLPVLPHAIGHGIGLEVHEYPHLGKKSVDNLEEGTVLAIEPAAYFSRYGVRYEKMVVWKKGNWRLA